MVEQVNNALEGRLTNDSRELGDQVMELNFIRHRLESFQTTIVKDVKNHMAVMVDEVMQELQQQELQIREFRHFANNNSKSRRNHNSEVDTWSNRALRESTSNLNEQNNENVEDSKGKNDQNKSFDHKNVEEKRNMQQQHQKSHSSKAPQTFPDKIFVNRESYLTALLKIDHMNTIYNIFQTVFVMFFLYTIAYDYFTDGSVKFGLNTLKRGFRGMHYVLAVWLLEHVFVFSLYYAFSLWSYVRSKLQSQGSLQSFWSHSCLILYITSQLVFGYLATLACLKLNLPYITSSILLLETTRLLMKMHAFVRTNAARVIVGKLKCDHDLSTKTHKATLLAPFSWYLYFLFAPTLLYRDSYPRTSNIRWKFVLSRFGEGLAVAFLFACLHERHLEVNFVNYGREPVTAADVILKIFEMCLPSTIIFLGGFYIILHVWLNFTSELLRFGDRMFYKDWWTAHNYDAFFRRWNVVVHDWLYEYIYKDSYNYIFHGSKTAASLMVFIVSAAVHEHILATALRFFFPVLFISFGLFGVFFVFLFRRVPKGLGNKFLWFTLVLGNSVLVCLYYMEYFARKNCSLNVSNESWSDVLIPMLWKCRT